MKKVLFIDVETTGLDPRVHGIWQLAGLIEIDGEVADEFNYKMNVLEGDEVEDEALEVGGITVDDLAKFDPPDMVFEHFKGILEKAVDKFDKDDKMFVAGYNVHFDVDFLANWYRALSEDKYGLGSFINWKKIDPLPVLHWLDYTAKLYLPNYKLQTVCERFGVPLEAHDAKSDIRATRELIIRIENKFHSVYDAWKKAGGNGETRNEDGQS